MTIAENYTISVIKPKAATNLITNPSFELGTTGWTVPGTNTIAQSSDQQRRGVFSAKCTYSNSNVFASYALTLTVVDYAASIDVYIPSGYDGTNIKFFTNGFTSVTTTIINDINMNIRDQWQRVSIKILPDSGDLSGEIIVYESGTNPTVGKFIYIDGFQVELGTVATTYFDGDMTGFIRNKQDYYWTGSPHASTSVRTKDAANGGELVDLGDYCKSINVYGLGIAPIQNVAIPLTKGGERFLYQQRLARFFDLELIFKGASGSTAQIGNLQKNRNDVINLLKPDRTAYDQPMVLRYQAYDTSNNPVGDPVDIKCQYVDGLNQAPINRFAERTRVTFRMSDKDFEADGDQGVELGGEATLSSVDNFIRRNSEFDWEEVSSGANGDIYDVKQHPITKDIYVCGAFTSIGGVSTDSIARFDGTTFYALGSGLNATTNAITFDAAGNLYACGSFTGSGATVMNRIGKWDGSSWSALGAGLNAAGYTMAFDSTGLLYVGGNFTQAAAVSGTTYIASWNGTTWAEVSGGLNAYCNKIKIDANDNVYVCGNFTLAGGVSGTAYIAKFNKSTNWVAMGTGLNGLAYSLEIDKSYNVYVGGAFTAAGGVTTSKLAKWVENKWVAIGVSFDTSVLTLYFDKNEVLWCGGSFTTAGTITGLSGIVLYKNEYLAPEIKLPATPIVRSFLEVNETNEFYVGFSVTGDVTISATTSTPEIKSATTYPIFQLTGPGTLSQIRNYTTGKNIYFDGLVLLAGEKVKIDLTPGRITMQSTYRGSILLYVSKGSNLDFPLTPDVNDLKAVYTGTTAASKITATWKKRLHYLGDAT